MSKRKGSACKARKSKIEALIVHKHVLPPFWHSANPYPAPVERLEDRCGYPFAVPPWERS